MLISRCVLEIDVPRVSFRASLNTPYGMEQSHQGMLFRAAADFICKCHPSTLSFSQRKTPYVLVCSFLVLTAHTIGVFCFSRVKISKKIHRMFQAPLNRFYKRFLNIRCKLLRLERWRDRVREEKGGIDMTLAGNYVLSFDYFLR